MTIKTKQDSAIEGAGAALKRAAKRAREIAERTRTPLVTYKDGHVQKRLIVRESNARSSEETTESR